MYNLKKTFHFTFIELAVVLVILSITATILGPRIVEGMGGRGLDAAVKRLAALSGHARKLAAATGNMYVMHLEIKEGLVYLSEAAVGKQPEPEAKAYQGIKHSFPKNVRVTRAELEGSVQTDVLKIRFTPDGWADNADVYLEDERGNKQKVAFTMSRGKVKIGEDAE